MRLVDYCEAEQNAALAEYEALHVEIGRHDQQLFEMFKFALTGAVAIISFALQQRAAHNLRAWAIAAIVPFVIVPAGLFSLARTQMQMRIGAYIRVFHEERSDALRWERSLSLRSKKGWLPDYLLATAIFAGYAVVGVAGFAVAWLIEDGSTLARRVLWSESAVMIAIALGVLFVAVFSGRNSMTGGDLKAFRDMRDHPRGEDHS